MENIATLGSGKKEDRNSQSGKSTTYEPFRGDRSNTICYIEFGTCLITRFEVDV